MDLNLTALVPVRTCQSMRHSGPRGRSSRRRGPSRSPTCSSGTRSTTPTTRSSASMMDRRRRRSRTRRHARESAGQQVRSFVGRAPQLRSSECRCAFPVQLSESDVMTHSRTRRRLSTPNRPRARYVFPSSPVPREPTLPADDALELEAVLGRAAAGLVGVRVRRRGGLATRVQSGGLMLNRVSLTRSFSSSLSGKRVV